MPQDATHAQSTSLSRDAIVARLAHHPPLENLFVADDLERQKMAAGQALTPAAVLLLIVNHPSDPTVVFTQRTAHLAYHAGQISFPGGRRHEEDATPEATALREAHEEVGIAKERVQVLGRMPEYHTSTGFVVTPIVGWAEPPLTYVADPREVDAIFEVPLSFLLDVRNHRYESAFFKGRMRNYWAMPYGDRFIWGATAGMLVTFSRIVGGA